MKYAQLVVGPAGSGKSTYCAAMVKHGEAIGRKISVVNMDPAAEHFDYNPIVDVRDLVSLSDVMEDEELKFGPNGGLVFCMEYIVSNHNWLEENFASYDDEYVLFDCPGQIELYTHMSVMKSFVDHLQRLDFRICAVFLLDSQFASDSAKFVSGVLVSLSTIINLEISSVNILTKVDLLNRVERRRLNAFCEPDSDLMSEDRIIATTSNNVKFAKLSSAISRLIDDYSLVKFFPLNIMEEDSMADVLLVIDNAIQFGEDADVKVQDFDEPDREEG